MLDKIKVTFFIVTMGYFIQPSSVKAEIKAFDSQSLQLIESSYLDRPFLLIVWSIDCLPCRQELKMIREVKSKYPALNLSIIATESLQQQDELESILTEHDLLEQDNWSFKHSNSVRLRFKLDPDWYGELPRAYFYDASHKRYPVSGALAKSQIVKWYLQVSK